MSALEGKVLGLEHQLESSAEGEDLPPSLKQLKMMELSREINKCKF